MARLFQRIDPDVSGNMPDSAENPGFWKALLAIANHSGVPPRHHQSDLQRGRASLLRARFWIEQLSRPRHSRRTFPVRKPQDNGRWGRL